MFLEYIKRIEYIFEIASHNGIFGQVVSSIISALFALYIMFLVFNYLILSLDKNKILIAFLTVPEAVYLLFYLTWMGCFEGRREKHFPLFLLAEFVVFLIMAKLVIWRPLNQQHKLSFR